ncbi:MAG: fructosamine kinase family protein [Mariprofundaceae bacterium]|nr:fructosamine kinase family protein [Mariprofundaceae bacterium]
MNDLFWRTVEQCISTCEEDFTITGKHSVGGGSISSAWRIEGREQAYFLKIHRAEQAAMFAAEMAGLAEIHAAGALRVPRPVCHGVAGQDAFLVCEWIDFGPSLASGVELLGSQLADMHRCAAELFGWERNNTIGSSPQINTRSNDWVAFWRDARIGVQLDLAASHGFGRELGDRGERLMPLVGDLLCAHSPSPSLLHGDLWGGNWACDSQGRPVLFDPATYFGDRETDIAMSELFGGFPASFYAAYRESWPLDDGYGLRRELYNLYHILNHANLFGGTYVEQSARMMDHLIAQVQ